MDGRTDGRSHRWTFVRYFGTQQVPIGMPRLTDGRTSQSLYATHFYKTSYYLCQYHHFKIHA